MLKVTSSVKLKEQQLVNTNAIKRHNAITISCDQQSRIFILSLIQTHLQFLIKVDDVTI